MCPRQIRAQVVLHFTMTLTHSCSETLKVGPVPSVRAALGQTHTGAHGVTRRLAAFSPREKVSEGRMRGKSTWQTRVYRIAETLRHHHFIRVHPVQPWLKLSLLN